MLYTAGNDASRQPQVMCPAPAPAPPMRYVQYNVSDIYDDQYKALSCHLSDGDLFPDVTQADFLR